MQKTESYCNDQKEIPHSDESLEEDGTAAITSVQLIQAGYNSLLDKLN